jgi:serine/threonine protein phosphatase 1
VDAHTGHTYAIGDLHGEVTLLRLLLAAIDPGPQDRFVFLGDYLDRGEDSVATVLVLAALARVTPCVFLRGNHDDAWLQMWDRDRERFVKAPPMEGAAGVWATWARRGGVPTAVGHFLAGTVTAYEDAHAYYVHAAAEPGAPFWQTPDLVRLWGLSEFRTSTYDWGKPVVFGHQEVEEPLLTPTKVGLDTAAYRTGVLTGLRVEDRALVQARR